MAVEILMPRQGQSVESCIIIEWKVAEGDVVTEGQPLCEVETDKATFEVESTGAGTVLGIFYPADADVEVLKTIAVVGEPGEDISAFRPEDTANEDAPSETEDQAPSATPQQAATEAIQASAPGGSSSGSSPRARERAQEKGVDLSRVSGSGPGGRIIERDVLAARPSPVSPAAVAEAAAEGRGIPATGSGIGGRVLAGDLTDQPAAIGSEDAEEIPVRGIRKVVAERMRSSLQNTAQLTLHASADARGMLALRTSCKAAPEASGFRDVTLTDIVLYATVQTLVEFPAFNAHWMGDRILQFKSVHLGLAVDTERGLMVPVIRHAEQLELRQLSAEAKRLATACIEGTIEPDDLTGGTFTVTNLGALGIERFTPVLNAPEVGILGVCTIEPKAIMEEGAVAFVPHIGLSLTIDHSAVDGAPAARFMAALKTRVAEVARTIEAIS